MSNNFFAAQRAAMIEIFARATNAARDAFEREELTISKRPEPAPWPFVMMVVGFGSGAVLCVEERYVEWAKASAPERLIEA